MEEEATMLQRVLSAISVAVLLVTLLCSIPGCTPTPYQENPDISGSLKQLISANERGEAEEFARTNIIRLVDGSVTVLIECEPGDVEAVAKRAGAYGIVELTTRRGLVQVVVPITKIAALADISGVRFVRLPEYGEEEEE